MNKLTIALSVMAAATASLLIQPSAHAGECGSSKSSKSAKSVDNSIAGIAAKASSFSTLNAALEAAGLDDELRGHGPFTVFAPTDEAFARLPKGTLESLLEPKHRDKLRAILLYHVVAGELRADDVTRADGAKTLNGQRLEFVSRRRSVRIDKAKVVAADVVADNGVIHGIDRVLLPASLDLIETAKSTGRFGSLLAALSVSDLDHLLGKDGPYTVLAPTDKAFARLGSDTIASLLEPGNRETLVAILSDHVIPGRIYAGDALAAGSVHSAAEKPLRFSLRRGRAIVEGARLVSTDLDASNGVIHVIDRVIVR